MTKMTKKNVFEALINYAEGRDMSYATDEGEVIVTADALKAFAAHEIELLDNKAEKAKVAAAKKKAAGDELTEAAYAVLTDEFQTIAQVTEQIDIEDVTNAKVQYRLNALVKAGRADKGEVTIEGAEGKKSRKVVAYKLLADIED